MIRTWLRFRERLAEISLASSDTKGKNVYRVILRRRLTSTGHTQPQGDPAGAYVNGSVHVSDEQSRLGGGGGSVKIGDGDGALMVFLVEELEGEIIGLGLGILRWLAGIAGDGTCAGEPLPSAEGRGD